jgi:hypothetical protein
MTAVVDRRAPRRRVLKDAKIVYLNNWTVVSCRVRDVSASGARIICGDQAAVPGEFRFMFTGEKYCRLSEVIWRRGELIGIRFTGPPEPAPVFRTPALSTAGA